MYLRPCMYIYSYDIVKQLIIIAVKLKILIWMVFKDGKTAWFQLMETKVEYHNYNVYCYLGIVLSNDTHKIDLIWYFENSVLNKDGEAGSKGCHRAYRIRQAGISKRYA